MSSLLHFSASIARETIKPQKKLQKLKTYSAPTVGNKVCDIEEHHISIVCPCGVSFTYHIIFGTITSTLNNVF